jgi:hypothetical protein
MFACLSSSIHYFWVISYGTPLETRPRYSVTKCFETFPFPKDLSGLRRFGETYHEIQHEIMRTRQEGLTTTYNRFHNPDEHGADIARLRGLHVEIDQAVAGAYGWGDQELGHGFHETAQGLRYTISEPARREVLSRLLKLNHERYEEEVRQGLHEKGKKSTISQTSIGAAPQKKKRRAGNGNEGQTPLF